VKVGTCGSYGRLFYDIQLSIEKDEGENQVRFEDLPSSSKRLFNNLDLNLKSVADKRRGRRTCGHEHKHRAREKERERERTKCRIDEIEVFAFGCEPRHQEREKESVGKQIAHFVQGISTAHLQWLVKRRAMAATAKQISQYPMGSLGQSDRSTVNHARLPCCSRVHKSATDRRGRRPRSHGSTGKMHIYWGDAIATQTQTHARWTREG
jgi:uncharacterized protein YggL (DUF469 family)